MHALCGVLLLRQRGPRHVWSLRARQPNIHPFYQSHPSIRRSLSPLFFFNLSCLTHSLLSHIDVLAHRQLAAAIGYAPLHATLHSKAHVERVLDVVNRKHRMAQMAGRASVEFYVGLALKNRGEREKEKKGKVGEVREEAFVIRTFRNGLGVFVSK